MSSSRWKCPANILRSAILGFSVTVCLPLPVYSQPPAPVPHEERFVPEIEKAWLELRAQVGSQEFSDPAAAIARYQQFYEQRGYRSAVTGVKIAGTIAQMYWRLLDNPTKALEIYDWALEKYNYLSQSKRLQKERDDIAAIGSFKGTGTAAPIAITPAPKSPVAKGVVIAPGKPGVIAPGKPAMPAGGKPTVIGNNVPPVVVFGGGTREKFTATPSAPPSRLAVNPRLTALAVYLEQWRSGRLSWEQFVQESKLTSADALELLSSPNMVVGWSRDKALRSQLAEIMQRDAELVREPTTLPPAVQYALGEYDSAQGNVRAEQLFQNLLKLELPEDGHPKAVSVLERLAQYYAGKGELKRAAETALKTEKYTSRDIWLGNMRVMAARYYREGGEEEKAQELYRQVQNSGSGWSKGLAIYDQSENLVMQGRYKEARQLLMTPITGQSAEQIRIPLLALLSHSYYKSGEWGEAKKYGEETIYQAQSVESLMSGEGLEAQVEEVKSMLGWIERWQKEPMIIRPNQLNIVVQEWESINGLLIRHFVVRSPQPISLKVTSDDPLIKVLVEDRREEQKYFFQQEVRVEIGVKADVGKLEATLSLSSLEHPGYLVRLPVRIRQ